MQLAEAFIPIAFSNLSKFKSDMGEIKKSLISELGGGLMKGLAIAGVAVGIGATITKSIRSAIDAENAIDGLQDALEANGEEVESNIKSLKEWGDNVSRSTTLSKKQAFALAESAMKYGKNAQDAKSYSTTAIGLAEKLGISQEEALESLMRLSNGDQRALKSLAKRSEAIQTATTKTALLDAINKEAAAGMGMLHGDLEKTEGKWNQLEKSVNRLYTTMGNALLPIIQAVIPAIQDFADWMMQLVGTVTDYNAALSASNETGTKTVGIWESIKSACKTIGEYIEGIVFALSNWDLYARKLGLSWTEFFVHTWDKMKWFGEQFAVVGKWLWNNWYGVLLDIGSIWITVWKNNIDWLKNLFSQVWEWVKSGFKSEMIPDFTNYDPLKGFKSHVAQGPQWTQYIETDFSDQERELNRIENERINKWANAAMKNKPKTAEAATKGLDAALGGISVGNAKGSGGGGGFTSIGEGWKKMQEALVKGEEKKTQKNIEKNTDRTAKGIERLAAKMDNKPRIAVAG